MSLEDAIKQMSDMIKDACAECGDQDRQDV